MFVPARVATGPRVQLPDWKAIQKPRERQHCLSCWVIVLGERDAGERPRVCGCSAGLGRDEPVAAGEVVEEEDVWLDVVLQLFPVCVLPLPGDLDVVLKRFR